MDIDLPVAEVRAAFEAYERALVRNDVAAVDAMFHVRPRTIRFGIVENLFGYDEIKAFRAARSPRDLARMLSHTVITTYGRDVAVCSTEPPRSARSAARCKRGSAFRRAGAWSRRM